MSIVNIPKQEAIQFFKDKRPSASFVSILGYRNTQGEVSNVEIITNINYERILEESIQKMLSIVGAETDEGIYKQGDQEFDEAWSEIRESLMKSLAGENERGQKLAEAFTPISKNVRLHDESQTIHLSGKKFKKTILREGTYKEVKSKTKTKIKNAIKEQLPVSEWRNYKLGDNFDSINIETETLTNNDLYKT